ncbi:MAG: CBS domain-containing protein [Alphaproteobacteria bacterium]|nr:CBS domain-containing protein [Alphaproteobacteria bacterium]
MTCSDIMDKAPLKLTPEITVEDALALMKKAGVRAAAVTDAAGTVMGLFSLRNLTETILPVSMVSDGGFAGVMIEAAPGLNLRLQGVMVQTVAAVMDRRFSHVYPDTSEAQAARLISQNGDSVIVMDENTGKLLGMISDQGMIEGLLKSSQARAKAVAQ